MRKVKTENRLGFRSSKTLEDFLLVFKHRYIDEHSPLPGWATLCKAVTLLPHRGAAQLLLPYMLVSDLLLEKYVANLVESTNAEAETSLIGLDHVVTFLSEESRKHSELARWSEKTRIRWAWRCLANLKTFGILAGTPSRISHPAVLPDTFAFFLLGLVGDGTSLNDSIEHPLWNFYLLRDEHKTELLAECANRGWVYYDEAGSIRQIVVRYPSVEAWLDARVARTSV